MMLVLYGFVGAIIGLILGNILLGMIAAYTLAIAVRVNDYVKLKVASIKATGGFARSEVWRQMMPDIFDTSVEVPESFESSCLGACMLGNTKVAFAFNWRLLIHFVFCSYSF